MDEKSRNSLKRLYFSGSPKARREFEVEQARSELCCESLDKEEIFCGQGFSPHAVVIQRHDADQFAPGVKSDGIPHPGLSEKIGSRAHDLTGPFDLFLIEVRKVHASRTISQKRN